ncbi:MAG TPA: CHAT domain-containing protein [Longimicrobium sp.]|nr:CHAT domain-containing protein [Longimicrobium sp.]
MRKVKVLFFAADPLSRLPDGREPRLLLDEDVREIRTKVRAAEHRDALEFDYHLAARPGDLLQALNETQPQVVHFSGHGGSRGLVLMDPHGHRPHYVDAAALSQLFQAFRGDIRLVVLNACFSLSQAEAIAEVVGCTIGTSGAISDEAAITFGARFYSGVAFGHSIQAAFDQARAELALSHFSERDCPRLVARDGVDPKRIRLVPPTRRISRIAKLAVGATGVAGALAAVAYLPRTPHTDSPIVEENVGGSDSSGGGSASSPSSAAQATAPTAAPIAVVDSVYRPPPVDDSGNLVGNGGFQGRFAEWTRSVEGGGGKGTNEIVSFADARSGHALHLAYEGEGSLLFAQKIPVSGPDYVFRGTFRASSHEGPMIGFSGTGIATVMVQYLDGDGQFLGMTSFYSYVQNPLANTPLVGVPRRGNGGNNVHYIDVEKERLYKDYELDIRREIEENLLGVVPDQVRTIAIALYCGATDDGAGAELWASDLSVRPRR